MNKDIEDLLDISSSIGNYSEYVQGGGGNTSVKIDNDKMLIKASGYLLKDIKNHDGYVCLNYKKIVNEISKISLKTEDEENRINNLIQDSRIVLEKEKLLRPSIETGFHALLKKYVIHSHSVYANIINCSNNSGELLKKIFDKKKYILIKYTSPGLGLTLSIDSELKKHLELYGCKPVFIFLENHGIIVNADTLEEAIGEHLEVNLIIKKYFNIKEKYPKIECKNDYISENKYILKHIIKNKEKINFENILFPDQVVYFKNNISFCKDLNKKINFNLESKQINYNVNSLKEAISIEETLLSYIYILDKINDAGLNPKFIKKKEQNYIENMESEIYRKKIIEKKEF